VKLDDLLLEAQRVSGTRRPITIINPRFWDQFFEWLRDAKGIQLQDKALVAIGLSGGLRVTEELSLHLRAFNLDNGFYKLKVLKKSKHVERTRIVDGKEEKRFLKAHDVHRDALLHPIAVQILRDYVKYYRIKYHDRLFTFTRMSAYRRIKNIFGRNSCPHMLRHSHASWLLHIKKKPIATAADIMKITPDKIIAYSHADTQTELTNLYEEN
jgi:integrase